MALTTTQTQGNGVTVSYPIVLQGGYFSNDNILVEFINRDTGVITEQSSSTYEILTNTVIFNTAPPSTVDVRIRRVVTNTSTYSTFERGNSFGKDNINNSFLQSLYQVQQLADGFRPDDFYWKDNTNAGNRKLTNLANGEDDQDAVTMTQLENAVTGGVGDFYRRAWINNI